MAYSGFLLKIGDYVVPHKYIKAESYTPYVNMQDLDPWTDNAGYAHREAVDLKAAKIEFETRALMTEAEFLDFMGNIQRNYTVPKARQFIFTAYIPEYGEYVTQTGYLADFTPTIYGIFQERLLNSSGAIGPVIKYNPIRMAIIGGVYDGGRL